jgi:MFS family permease
VPDPGDRGAAVLRHPGFRLLWLANLAGDLGQQFSTLALSVTAVLVLHAGPLDLGLINALAFAPNLVLSLPAGVWVDRWRRKRVLALADACRGVAVATIPVAYVLHSLTTVHLMVVAAAAGTASVFFDTAHTSVLPALVSRERVSEANARLQTSDTTVGTVGPGVAGQLLRLTSGPALYLVTSAMHLLSTLLILRMPVDERRQPLRARDPFWPALRTGLAFVATHPILRTFTLSNAAINLGAGVFFTIVPLYVLRDLHVGAATYGLVVSIGSTGGIAGSLLALRIRRSLGEIRTKVVSNCAVPLAFAAMPLAGLTSVPLVLLGVSEFLFGLFITVGLVSATGVRARVTPDHLMGRVSAASRFVTQGAIPVGALLAGAVAASAGNEAALWFAGSLAAVGAVITLVSPIRSMRDLPAAAHAPSAAQVTLG